MLPGLLVTGIGVGLTIPSLSSAAAASLPPNRFSTGVAVLTMSRQIGAAIGVAILVAILGTQSGPSTLGDFQNAWVFMALASIGASLACLALGRVRVTGTEPEAIAEGALESPVLPPPAERSRVVTWQDPVAAAAHRSELGGLEYLEGIRNGSVPPPPMALLMGFEFVEASEGRALFAAVPDEYHYNPIGAVHGGLAATLLDSATGCAVQTTLEPGLAYTTVELKVNFVRPMTRDTGRVLCEATVVHRGGTIATAEGRLTVAETGKLIAHGTATCLVMNPNGHTNGTKPARSEKKVSIST
jgi:uncharacterized protein (TIGR00369 family)